MIKSTLRPHWPYILFLVIPIVIFYHKILFAGWLICGGDYLNQFVPWREFAVAELKKGRFPWWNPMVFCGAPFAANIQTALFYPWNLFHLIFSVERTFSLSLVFHHTAALAGMYLFLYSLYRSRSGAVIGAVIYGWSGFLITHAHDGHLIHAGAYALIPFVLFFQTQLFRQKKFLFLFCMAAGISGMFYAGHTQIPLYMFYVILARAAWKSYCEYQETGNFALSYPHTIKTMGAIILSLMLGALVLLPLAELSQNTAGRAGGADYSFATSDSLPLSHLITFAAPFFYGSPTAADKESKFWETQTGFHEICGYTGIFSFLLCFLAFLPNTAENERDKKQARRETVFFFTLALGGLFFSLGKFNPLYPILYYGLPGWNYFRVPGRLVLLFVIGISVCSARGFSLWARYDKDRLYETKAFKTITVVTAVFLLAGFLLLACKSPVLTILREIEVNRTVETMGNQSVDRLRINLLLPQKLFDIRYGWMLQSFGRSLLFLGGCWLALFWVRKVKSKYRWCLPAFIVIADLFLFSSNFIEMKPPTGWKEAFYPQTSLVQFLKENCQNSRILCLDDAIGQPGLAYHPELRPNRLMRHGIETVRGYDPIILKSYVRFVNHLYNYPADTPQGGLLFFPFLPESGDLSKMNIRYIITVSALPSPCRLAWSEPSSPVKIYENPHFLPQVYWKETQDANGIDWISETPARIELQVKTEVARHLFFSQNYYPGWECRIDGQQVPIDSSSGFITVLCPQNSKNVVLHFYSKLWMLGFIITLASILCGFWYIRREKRTLCDSK